MRIEIEINEVETRSGIIKSGDRKGEAWSMRSQVGWLSNGGKYPVKVSIPLKDDQPPYAAGFYTFAPECFEAGDFDRLQFARHLTLVPLVESVRAPARAAG